MTTLFSIIESPHHPRLEAFDQRLGIIQIKRPAQRKALQVLTHRMSWRLIIVLLIGLCTACEPANRAASGPTPDIDVIELSIGQAHQALRSGRISCEQLTRRYLRRIETYDPPTKADAAPGPSASRSPTPANRLNAIIAINPNALARARQLDRQYAETGHMRRLHCIPVILKDNFDTADMPTEAGSIALKGSVPPDEAFLVRRLRAEDAIILAKSNMGEWAFSPYQTISSTHGETRNAYALDRVPAGSSGGIASVIAANLGLIGMGTDTGNSIRGPASHLALVGLRPTLGASSRDGIVPLLANRDVGGPLMRTVTDTAIVYSVLAGYDPADPLTQAAIGRVKPDYRRYLKRKGLQGARLGVLRALVETEADTAAAAAAAAAAETDTADPEVVARFDQAIYDLIWAEGSAYILGVERALEAWLPMLRPGGGLVFSDMVWRTDHPTEEVRQFWASDYPAMTTVPQRLQQATRAGYSVVSHLDMGQSALDSYYQPLEARLLELEGQIEGTRVLDDLRRELRAYHEGNGQFGYEMFVLVRR